MILYGENIMAKGYKYYACCKYGHGGGIICEATPTMQEAANDLIKLLDRYATNDLIFAGVIKCKDGDPLGHIYTLS